MTDKELNKMFFNTIKAPYYDRMIGNSNTNFSNVVSVGEMIESGVQLDKIEGMEAKKSTLKKKKERRTRSPIKEKHTTHPTHDSQTGITRHIINMLGAAHKETTSPTLG